MTSRSRSITHALLWIGVVVACAALRDTFDSSSFLVIVALAGALATVLSIVLHRRGVAAAPSMGASLAALVVFGTGAVSRSVSPAAVGDFVSASVHGWRNMLDRPPPLSSGGPLLAVPLVIGWVSAAVAAELTARTRSSALPILGPLMALALSVLFGTVEASSGAVIGGLLVAICLFAIMSRGDGSRGAIAGDRVYPSLALGVTGVLMVSIVAPAVTSSVFASNDDRYVLRREYTPAFDPDTLGSPLSLLAARRRSIDAEGNRLDQEYARELFVIQGEPVDRVRIAALSTYDDVVFGLSSTGTANLTGVSPTLPPPEHGGVGSGERLDHTITVTGFRDQWLPVPGAPTEIDALGEFESSSILFDREDGNLLTTSALDAGDGYRIRSRAIEEYGPTSGALALVSGGVPPDETISALAAQIVGDAPGPVEQLDRLIAWFGEHARYDVNAAENHYLDRLRSYLADEEPAGYEEQVSASFALLARSLGIDVRVVVGYSGLEFEGGRETVVQGQLSAWNEVRLADNAGWAYVDVTPVRQVTDVVEPESSASDGGQLPAPPPTSIAVTPPTTVPAPIDDLDEVEERESEASGSGVGLVGWLAVLVGITVSGVALRWLLVLASKRRRRQRRKHAPEPHRRIAGAWEELLDRGVDYGFDPVPGETLRERADALARHGAISAGEVSALALMTEHAGFEPEPPTEHDAAWAWGELDRLEALYPAGVTRRSRVRASSTRRSLRAARSANPSGRRRR